MTLINKYDKNDLSYKDIIENNQNYKINYMVFEDSDEGESWYAMNLYYIHSMNICIILYYDIDSSDDGDGNPTELERYEIYKNIDFKNNLLNNIQDEINSMYDYLGYFETELYTFDSIDELNDISDETKYIYNIIQNISIFDELKNIHDKFNNLSIQNDTIKIDNISYNILNSIRNNNQILYSSKYNSINVLDYYNNNDEIYYSKTINFYDNLIEVHISNGFYLNLLNKIFERKDLYLYQVNNNIIDNILTISKPLLYNI